jgi:hypothetical protein
MVLLIIQVEFLRDYWTRLLFIGKHLPQLKSRDTIRLPGGFLKVS